jgi:hypothetical protein
LKRLPTFICLVFLLTLILAADLGAEESHLLSSIEASSIYWDPVLRSWGNEVKWIFTPADSHQGAHGYALEVRIKGSTSPTALIRYGGKGRLRKVTRFLSEHGRTRRIVESFSGPFALSDGFPVPFDYLAPENPELRRAKVRKRAGGSVFLEAVQRTVREISLDEAMSDGLIKDEVKGLIGGKELRMIEISKKGSISVRQLWATGLSWWVYEESPFRKSWLIDISMEKKQ